MIRRGFWLTVGAAGGIIGYRRVSSLARQVSETLGGRRDQPRAVPANRVRRHWARETIRFARDVREGMDQYSVRHPRTARPTLGPGTRAGDSTGSSGSTGSTSTRSTDHEREDH